MSRLWARFKGLFSSRTLVGTDKAGNRYFTVTEEIDGVSKWVFSCSLYVSESVIVLRFQTFKISVFLSYFVSA